MGLEGGAHLERFRVGMRDVDAFGIAYFAAYWEWYQATLEGLIEREGRSMREVLDDIGLPMVHGSIDYLAPVRLSDPVAVELAVVAVGRRSVTVRARFVGPDGTDVARVEAVHVVARADLSAAEPPPWLRDLVREYPW